MSITVNNISKKFSDFQALDNINLNIQDDKLVALLGPSGSGKSTLLRVIAGLEDPDTGSVVINGQDTTHIDVRLRNIGFVFQHYALFKHLTVRQNIAFGLEIRRKPQKLIKSRVDELLELIQLEGLGNRYPSQLSGGQRQRVALARALAVQPKVLLLDEPFGALDAKVRKELRAWLRRLHDEVHVTTVFVTHDQEEAMEVADEIVVMNKGKVEQVGTPAHVYDHPKTPFVMSFIGQVNVLPSILGNSVASSIENDVFIRPHDIEVTVERKSDSIAATVQDILHIGWEIRVELLLPNDQIMMAHFNREKWQELALQVGQTIFIQTKNTRSFTPVDITK